MTRRLLIINLSFETNLIEGLLAFHSDAWKKVQFIIKDTATTIILVVGKTLVGVEDLFGRTLVLRASALTRLNVYHVSGQIDSHLKEGGIVTSELFVGSNHHGSGERTCNVI